MSKLEPGLPPAAEAAAGEEGGAGGGDGEVGTWLIREGGAAEGTAGAGPRARGEELGGLGDLEDGEAGEVEGTEGEEALKEGTRVRPLGGESRREGTVLDGVPLGVLEAAPFEVLDAAALGVFSPFPLGVFSPFPLGVFSAFPLDRFDAFTLEPFDAFMEFDAATPFPLVVTGIRDSTGFLGVGPTKGCRGEYSLCKSSFTSRIGSSFPPFLLPANIRIYLLRGFSF